MAALPVVGGPLGELLAIPERVRSSRRNAFIDELLVAYDWELEYLRRAVSDERLADLIDRGVRAAEATRDGEHLRLIAKITADGMAPDQSAARLDADGYLLRVMGELAPADVAVLVTIAAVPSDRGHDFHGMSMIGWTPDMLSAEMPEFAPLMPMILQKLSTRWLIRDLQAGQGYENIGPREQWLTTEAGSDVVWRLTEMGYAVAAVER